MRNRTNSLVYLLILILFLSASGWAKYSGGTGEPNAPYLISTPNDLNSIGADPCDWDKHFLMTADINMADYDGQDGRPIFSVIGYTNLLWESPPTLGFSGVFDGADHKISHLSITNYPYHAVALFGYVDGSEAQVRDLILDKTTVSSVTSYCAALAGRLEQGHILHCIVRDANISGNDYVGAIVGDNWGHIEKCSGNGNFTGDSQVGGIAGRNQGMIQMSFAFGTVTGETLTGGVTGRNFGGSMDANGTIINSYALVTVSGNTSGGLVGQNWGGNVSNTYAAGDVTHGAGGLIGSNTSGGVVSNSFWDYEATNRLSSDGGEAKSTLEMKTKAIFAEAGWDFDTPVWTINEGVDYPQLVWDANECYYCAASGGGDVYIKDVQIGIISNTDTDSNGYTYYTSMATNMDTAFTYPAFVNLYFNQLIPNNCRIYIDWNQDCDFDDPNEEIIPELMPYSATHYFVGITPPTGASIGETRMRVRVTGGSIPNPCGSTLQGEVEDYTVNITDQGVCGQTQFGDGCGTPEEPYLIYEPEHFRAIGKSNWTWDRHFKLTDDIDLAQGEPNNFDIIGDGYVFYSPFDPPEKIGILFNGVFDGNSHSINNASLALGESVAVGLFGTIGSNAEVRDLILSNACIEANTSSRVGALAGDLFDGDIIRCQVRDANVQGNTLVGGLVGYSYQGFIAGCSATGDVKGDECVGGLAGSITATATNCWSRSDVQGVEAVGGLIGEHGGGTTWQSYAAGPVSGDTDVGGLIGVGGGLVSASFWDVNATGHDISAGGTPKTTSQMQTRSTFTDAGWNFNTIWDICDGTNYPRHIWQIPIEGDFGCPDGVDFIDYSFLADQWLLEELEQDYNYDGFVDFYDWADFANNWDGDYSTLETFLMYWLARSARQVDIAPASGDDFVDWQDLMLLCENWLQE